MDKGKVNIRAAEERGDVRQGQVGDDHGEDHVGRGDADHDHGKEEGQVDEDDDDGDTNTQMMKITLTKVITNESYH